MQTQNYTTLFNPSSSTVMTVPTQKLLPNSTTKSRKSICFEYPLNHTVVKNCSVVTEFLGNLKVEGVGYTDGAGGFSVDIEFIWWQDNDIKAVFEGFNMLDEIEAAALNYTIDTFSNNVNA